MVFLITISVKKFKKIWFGVAISVSGDIIKISFSKRRKDVLNAITSSLTQNWQIKNNNSEARTVLETINNLFCGKKNVNQLKVDLTQTTRFQKAVYSLVKEIPRGKVSTYSRIAKEAGYKGANRAVGNAMASNPYPLLIPCHRVINSNLKIGRYSVPALDETESSKLKHLVLQSEGVKIKENKVAYAHIHFPKKETKQ